MPLLNPQQPVIEHVEVSVAYLPNQLDGLKVAHLSDLHYDRRSDPQIIERAVQAANLPEPDLTVITGDFLNLHILGNGLLPVMDSQGCARILGRLRARLGIFAVLGNHDKTDPATLIRALEFEGIRVLHNCNASVERQDSRLWLAGVEDVLTGSPDLSTALRGIPRCSPIILLAHEPDFADVAATRGIALQLSGHSHGGQIRLPGMPPLYLPPLARKYPWGLRTVGSMKIYTSRGVGTSMLPIRLNCSPEVALITLRAPLK
jgi:predicted MPP superfamily phosphohydrolase